MKFKRGFPAVMTFFLFVSVIFLIVASFYEKMPRIVQHIARFFAEGSRIRVNKDLSSINNADVINVMSSYSLVSFLFFLFLLFFAFEKSEK